MKNALLLLGLCVTLASCSEDENQPLDNTDPQTTESPENPANPGGGDNNVLLLQVDATTFAFEGGKELTFDTASTFTIATDYVAPGDFGSVKLRYDELDATLFDGTITWMGLGEMSYPETIDSAESFVTLDEALEMPELADFYEVVPGESEEGLQSMDPDHQAIWAAIDNLEAVKNYRESNPEAKISLFLYTPSVGIGNPEEWDWFVILKN